jgi:hypothetical protein
MVAPNAGMADATTRTHAEDLSHTHPSTPRDNFCSGFNQLPPSIAYSKMVVKPVLRQIGASRLAGLPILAPPANLVWEPYPTLLLGSLDGDTPVTACA